MNNDPAGNCEDDWKVYKKGAENAWGLDEPKRPANGNCGNLRLKTGTEDHHALLILDGLIGEDNPRVFILLNLTPFLPSKSSAE